MGKREILKGQGKKMIDKEKWVRKKMGNGDKLRGKGKKMIYRGKSERERK